MRLSLTLVALAAITVPIKADPITFDLQTIPVVGHGINDNGQIVGDTSQNGHTVGFVYQNGSSSLIQFPGSYFTSADAINNCGNIVGYYSELNMPNAAFLDVGGVFTPINPPNVGTGGTTVASAINNAGQIVGWFPKLTGSYNSGFVYSGGTYTVLNPPNSINTYLTGINDTARSSVTSQPAPMASTNHSCTTTAYSLRSVFQAPLRQLLSASITLVMWSAITAPL